MKEVFDGKFEQPFELCLLHTRDRSKEGEYPNMSYPP